MADTYVLTMTGDDLKALLDILVDSNFAVYIKGNTQWKEGELRIKSSNNWIEPNKLFVKQNNTWTEI